MENQEILPQPTETQKQEDIQALVSNQVDIDYFMKVELRVAQITSVEIVPKSKKLYKLQVSLGELGERQILSGLALHYTPEELLNRRIIIVANLKPAKLMGLESQGMLLAGSDTGDTMIKVVDPGMDLPLGARVR